MLAGALIAVFWALMALLGAMGALAFLQGIRGS